MEALGMNKGTAIRVFGRHQITIGFGSDEWKLLRNVLELGQFKDGRMAFTLEDWYDVQTKLRGARGSRKVRSNNIRLKWSEKWTKVIDSEIDAYTNLISKIDIALYEFESGIQEKLDEQPKWVQWGIKHPILGAYGSFK
jgi:hypothetical protein